MPVTVSLHMQLQLGRRTHLDSGFRVRRQLVDPLACKRKLTMVNVLEHQAISFL